MGKLSLLIQIGKSQILSHTISMHRKMITTSYTKTLHLAELKNQECIPSL